MSIGNRETLGQQEAFAEVLLAVGDKLADRFEVLAEGRRGGMGVVYKCRDRVLRKTVALKTIHPRFVTSDQARERFRREVAISQDLTHPNIARVNDLGIWNNIEYFTTRKTCGRRAGHYSPNKR